MLQTLAVYFIMLSATSAKDCGDDGYTATNYKNRGYLKLHKKLNNSTDCFKCWRSGQVYKVLYDGHDLTEYSHICVDDPSFYQVIRSFLLTDVSSVLILRCFPSAFHLSF